MAVSMGMRGLTLLIRIQGLTLKYLERPYIVHFLFLMALPLIKKMSIPNEIYDGYEVFVACKHSIISIEQAEISRSVC